MRVEWGWPKVKARTLMIGVNTDELLPRAEELLRVDIHYGVLTSFKVKANKLQIMASKDF